MSFNFFIITIITVDAADVNVVVVSHILFVHSQFSHSHFITNTCSLVWYLLGYFMNIEGVGRGGRRADNIKKKIQQ